MLHAGAVNHIDAYLTRTHEGKFTKGEQAAIDQRNTSRFRSVLGSALLLGLPTYFVFNYGFVHIPEIAKFRRPATAGIFLFGALVGFQRVGHQFMLDFLTVEDSKAAQEAREIIRRDCPQHPLLLHFDRMHNNQQTRL